MELWEIRNSANYKQTAHSLSRKTAGNISVGSQQNCVFNMEKEKLASLLKKKKKKERYKKAISHQEKKTDLTKKHFYTKHLIVSFEKTNPCNPAPFKSSIFTGP